MKTYLNLWYIAEFFLEGEMFQKEVLKKIKKIIFNNIFTDYRAVCELMWKHIAQNAIEYGACALHAG